ncbi:MAG: hypothetical protein KA120_07780 [Candidatus Goldbacteria bacterium]|nr:hypothetical protein [Candidatus Goldiibacteriota bacterium]
MSQIKKNSIIFLLLVFFLSCNRTENIFVKYNKNYFNNIEIKIQTKLYTNEILNESIIINRSAKKILMDLVDSKCIFDNFKFYGYNKNNTNGILINYEVLDLKSLKNFSYKLDTNLYEWRCLEQKKWTPEEIQIKINEELFNVNKYIYKFNDTTWEQGGIIKYLFCDSLIQRGEGSIDRFKEYILKENNKIKGINRLEIYAYKGIPLKVNFFYNKKLIISQYITQINFKPKDLKTFILPSNISFNDITESYKKNINKTKDIEQDILNKLKENNNLY